MKLFNAVLLFSSSFIPADFHPINGLISSELTDMTRNFNETSESFIEVIIVMNINIKFYFDFN